MSNVEFIMGNPRIYIARAVDLAAYRPEGKALDFVGNADGSAGVSLRVRLAFNEADGHFPVQWRDDKGQIRRDKIPVAAVQKWLESFFDHQVALLNRQAQAAPTRPIEIAAETAPAPRKAKAGQMSLF